MIEMDSQAVLNTLSEHDFQDAFKNGRSASNGAYTTKETTLKAMVAGRPKVCREHIREYKTAFMLVGIEC
jgi:hypothetical protein